MAGEQADRAVLILVSVRVETPALLTSGSPEAQNGMTGEAARRLQRSVVEGELRPTDHYRESPTPNPWCSLCHRWV